MIKEKMTEEQRTMLRTEMGLIALGGALQALVEREEIKQAWVIEKALVAAKDMLDLSQDAVKIMKECMEGGENAAE